MYRDRAELYDLIYHWKNYQAEAARVREKLAAEGIPDGSRVLEAACGTGSYLQHLRESYDLTGFDRSEEMLAIAREKLPAGLTLFRADMAGFTVDRPYDALLCLFSSIGYLYPEARLRAAAKCFADAVRPGGVLVIEPWIAPEEYRPGYGSIQTYDRPELKLCRASLGQRDGDIAVMDFHWLVLRTGADAVEHLVDVHRMWLCPRELMLRVFREAGFECRLDPEGLMPGRGLIIGRRR